MSKAFVAPWRSLLLFSAILLAFGVVQLRLFDLQVLRADQLALEAESNRRSVIPLEGRRGNISDRDGNIMAGTISRVQVGMDPYLLTDRERQHLPELALLLGMSEKDLHKIAANRFRVQPDGSPGRPIRWVPLAVVDDPTFEKIRGFHLRAIYGNRRYERHYPGEETAAHLLGFINREFTAVMGMERALDFYLSGEKGWRETEVDGRRREVAVFRSREVSPRDGYHVELTLDLYIQSILEDELRKLEAEFSPKGATIIVSDPQNGDILALANYPVFNPNRFWESPVDNQRNLAVTDILEPGSTFKIVPIAAAIEEGLIHPGTLIDCSEAVAEYRGRRIPLPSDTSRLGEVPLTTVVAKSSNRGAAKIGMMLGEEKLYDYTHAFGFGKESGWLLSGEVNGILHPINRWDGLTISRLPTGYAIGATPMQIHLAMATIANEGVYTPPRLARRIYDDRGETVLELPHLEGRRVVSAMTSEYMAEMLTLVVGREGTARRAEIPGFQVAGKTGTSRKIINGRYSTSHHFASFTGFFPANNPRVVITIVVDEPQLAGSGYGGLVAAPVFKSIAEKLIPHLGIQKPEPDEPMFVYR
jgi:cell division protein FtsI/penicillin-binding protein 2